MSRATTRVAARKRRHTSIRLTVEGNAARPRLAIFRSLNHIYAQVIDDQRGATLAAVVTMLMTPPRTTREWAVGLISTVVSSIGGGAFTVEYFQFHHWALSTTGLCAMGGLMFACGLPGWALVRWIFNFIDKNRDASIDDIAKNAKELL
mgnify:CR=1 FL=1